MRRGTREGNTTPAAGALFTCRRCANLIYESAEKTSAPSPGRTVDHHDRFIRRLSGGVLRGDDLDP